MGYELIHSTGLSVSKGMYYPLGATLREGGVNFAIYSQNATEVFLLLFNASSSLGSGEDLLDPGREAPLDPPDHYLANPGSTVVLLGKA